MVFRIHDFQWDMTLREKSEQIQRAEAHVGDAIFIEMDETSLLHSKQCDSNSTTTPKSETESGNFNLDE